MSDLPSPASSAPPARPASPVPPVPPEASAPAPRRWIRWAAVILAAAGWWISVDLLRLSLGVDATNPLIAAKCGPTGEGDCLSVLRSHRARVFSSAGRSGDPTRATGMPWAALGMAYFALAGVWYAFVGPPTFDRRWWHVPIACVVLIGATVSLDLTQVMAFQLRRICQGCLATHVINLLLALLTLAAFPWRRPVRPAFNPHPSRSLALASMLAALLMAYLQVSYATLGMQAQTIGVTQRKLNDIINDADYARLDFFREPAHEIPLREDEPFVGDPTAPNTVVVFSDFECPTCRTLHERIRQVVARHPSRLRVAIRHFPLDSRCNPSQTRVSHPAACRAAGAAEAARIVGGGALLEKLRGVLYERQNDLELEEFDDWAAALGADRAAFAAARGSPAVADRVREDCELGGRLKVTSVPAVFLNGRRLEYWHNDKTWDALLGVEPAATQPASNP
ncbi:MAG: hypothetical protein CHACPFDD_01357 [Phycisphaerae bacterium]|nr:hypothetical protein [Phycisphaerae bacterium]